MHKKIVEGFLDVCYEDTALYDNNEASYYAPKEKITEQLEEFNGKKVRITIEEIE